MNFTEDQKEKALKLSENLSSEFDEKETEDFAKKHTGASWYHNFKLLFDMDDAFVLGFVMKQLSGEIEKYKIFKGIT